MSDKPNWPTNSRSAGYFHETCFSLAQTERLTTFLLASMTLFYPSLHPMIIESLKPPAYFPRFVSFISSFILFISFFFFFFLKIFNFYRIFFMLLRYFAPLDSRSSSPVSHQCQRFLAPLSALFFFLSTTKAMCLILFAPLFFLFEIVVNKFVLTDTSNFSPAFTVLLVNQITKK